MSDLAVGVIGLGNMGEPMIRRLVAAGFRCRGYDADEARLARLAGEIGFGAAMGPADLARGAEIVLTMLPNGRIVREVVLGPGGAADGLAPGAILLDMGSSDPTGTVELAQALAARGIALVDAPVSGGVAGAANGTLAILIGGDDEAAVERCRPVLAALGTKIFRIGAAGSGHATKAINNFLGATIVAATAEGLVIGERFGIDPMTLLDAINASTGASLASQNLFKGQILNGKYSAGFALALMAKDVGQAASLAETLGLETPLAAASSGVWAAARDWLRPGADFTEMMRYVEQRNGVERA